MNANVERDMAGCRANAQSTVALSLRGHSVNSYLKCLKSRFTRFALTSFERELPDQLLNISKLFIKRNHVIKTA